MTGSEIALIITATGTAITAVGGVVIAVMAKKTSVATQEVHTMVNQQRTDAKRYEITLIKAMKAAGIDIPDDQSLYATNQEGIKSDGQST